MSSRLAPAATPARFRLPSRSRSTTTTTSNHLTPSTHNPIPSPNTDHFTGEVGSLMNVQFVWPLRSWMGMVRTWLQNVPGRMCGNVWK